MNPLDKLSLSNIWHLLATGFGSGLSPVVPGTMGTLASIPLYLLLVQASLPVYLLVIVITGIVGVKICQVASDDMGVHDHGSIVWDEFVGFWITMSIVPMLKIPRDRVEVVDCRIHTCFAFLIWSNLWPIGWLDKRIHGGIRDP